ncbi:MAG: hypothetical protein HY420_03270 [Candidatus Kerfeldbacteria bacterium]|nr:hypothetical protein [Candidatus Kerfeldbacteria bacterium]
MRHAILVGTSQLAVLALTIVFVVFYYSADHRYPPCCDTAHTLVRAKAISMNGSTEGVLPYNPSYREPLYGSFVSEFPVHILLSLFYQVQPDLVGDLTFAKKFFVVFFVLPAFSIYILANRLLRSSVAGVVVVLLVYFAYLFGNSYWSGHVAQILGMFLIPLYIYFIFRYEEEGRTSFLYFALVLLLFSFWAHVLTFLILLLVAVSYAVIKIFSTSGKVKATIAFTAFGGGAVAYFLLVPSSFLPHFATNPQYEQFGNVVANSFGNVIFLTLLIIGCFFAIRQKRILIVWFLVTYLLTQSTWLGVPFFGFRFTEFIITPVALLAVYGMKESFTALGMRKTGSVAIAVLLIIFLPFGLLQQQHLKSCYVNNCLGLNPTQIPPDDLRAFSWIKANLPETSVFAGPQKFGYYLPFVTDNPIEFPIIERILIFTASTAAERWRIAKDVGINYVFWDAIIDSYKNEHPDFKNYAIEPLENEQYFKKIYDEGSAKIFAVR